MLLKFVAFVSISFSIFIQFTCPESYVQIDSANYSPSRRCGEYLNAITTDTVAGTVTGLFEMCLIMYFPYS